jgi:hypothetical protein
MEGRLKDGYFKIDVVVKKRDRGIGIDAVGHWRRTTGFVTMNLVAGSLSHFGGNFDFDGAPGEENAGAGTVSRYERIAVPAGSLVWIADSQAL